MTVKRKGPVRPMLVSIAIPYAEPQEGAEAHAASGVTPVSRWGVEHGTTGAANCCQRFDVAPVSPARASTRWRSMAR
jgi:hypothetical protein